MKIKDINIHKFGPMEGFRLEAAPVTVIYGRNESGKTTILDALLEALFSVSDREVKKDFEGIDRYEEGNALEGNVSIERRGTVLTYPSSTGDTLDKLAGFPPVYIRNLLVVRDSDLQFSEKHSGWWSEVKDHLSGFAGGLDAVADSVCDETGMTKEGDWINEKGRRIKDEVNNLRDTEKDIEFLQEKVEELARLHSKLKQLSVKREVTQKHLALQKRAHQKEQLETATVLRRKYAEEQKHLEELLVYGDDIHTSWRKLETEMKGVEESIAALEHQKSGAIEKINETEKEAAHREEEARNWTRKESEITPEVNSGLHETRQLYEKERKLLADQNFLIGGVIILCALSLLFLVFSIFRSPNYWLPTVACLGAAGTCAGFWLFRRKLSRQLAILKQDLLQKFRSFGEQASDIDDIETWIFTARQSSEQAKGAAESLTHEAERERNELQQIALQMDDKKDFLKRLNMQLVSLKEETDCIMIEDLEAKIGERNHTRDEIQSLEGRINLLLGCATEEDWDEKLGELEEYVDIEALWDEDTQKRLEAELPLIAEEEKLVNEQCIAVEKTLIEHGCNSPEEAWQMQEDVTRRLLSYELDRRAAEVALGVITELSEHQDTIINTVLESGSDSATHYFRQVTGGRYNNIFWRDDNLYVQTPNGNTLDIGSLSTGTRAQLQFSLRMSLLQHLFGGEPLFLLLDDPFLSSDRERVKEMLGMLADFSGQGWQIFYFTVDEEVPLILKDIDPDNVTVKNLERLEV